MSLLFQVPHDIDAREPAFIAPTGPVWILDAATILPGSQTHHDQPYVVRRLAAASSLLVVGAMLGHAGSIDHPRLHGPAFWTRAHDAVWIATPAPAGEPLASIANRARLTWSASLELWRPLAEAVRSGHGRGIVHGSLNPWNVWLDEAAGQLTAIDVGCWVGDHAGDDAWWPEEMRGEPSLRHPRPQTDIYSLARLLLTLSLNAAEAEQRRPSLSGVPAFAIPAIDRSLAVDPDQRLARVDELLTATTFSTMAAASMGTAATVPATAKAPEDTPHHTEQPAPKPPVPVNQTTVLFGRVSDREELKNAKFGRGVRFFVHHADAQLPGAQATTGAFFYEGADPDIYHSVKWIWDGAEINLFDARVVQDSTKRRFLTSQPQTLPVLEPHWPVSVTDVLKSERCTSRFLVDQRDSGSSSRALVFGNLVHGLLEDLLQPEPPDFATALEARLPSLRLDMLAAQLGDDDLNKLCLDARQHFENMQKFSTLKTQPEPDSQPGANRIGWSGGHVEATRYSSLYGLEGRIDLVTEDEREGLQIIELKSGGAWDGHMSQVRCYTLLWGGLAERQGSPVSGYLLYSKQGRLSAAPMDDVARERRILRARNELVACHRSYVDPTYEYTPPHYMQVPKNCQAAACKWRSERCEEQTAVLGLDPAASPRAAAARGGAWHGVDPEIVERAWAYHDHFTRLIEMERWAENSDLGLILQRHRLPERVANRTAAADLAIVEVDTGAGLVTFGGRSVQIFSPGDYLVAHRGDFNYAHILRGKCIAARHQTLTLSTQGASVMLAMPREGWILDVLPARIGFRTAHRALYTLLRSRDPQRLEVLLAPGGPTARRAMQGAGVGDLKLLSQTRAALNDAQREAVVAGISAPVGSLIQGPPGTGKTTVIAHLVRELVARNQRVLLSALTNTAVDTMLAKLLEAGHTDFLRVGSKERSRELAQALRAHGLEPDRFFTEELGQHTTSLAALAKRIDDCPVIGCTAYGAVSSSMADYLRQHAVKLKGAPIPFDVAIVDEAGQLTEPMTLGPLNMASRFVLVGDHRQLPPIVKSEQAQSTFIERPQQPTPPPNDNNNDNNDDNDAPQIELGLPGPIGTPAGPSAATPAPTLIGAALEGTGCAGLDRSLFERLIVRLPHVVLEEQYRMNDAIMAFSNREFYDGRLIAHTSVASRLIDAVSDHSPTTGAEPVVFVDVDSRETGRTNTAEAEAIVETIVALAGAAIQDGTDLSLGVVTPFRAQVYLIRDLLQGRLPEGIDPVQVDTVERFQGSERDVIVVSLVKTERAGDFLSDQRRLNVTLTRARKKLIIFGNRRCLELNPLYRRLIEQTQTYALSWNHLDT